jgi:hypothetical protein
MTEREIFLLQKKYPDSEVMNKGRMLRRNLDEIIFIIKVNNQLNEINKKSILEELIIKSEKSNKLKKRKK